MRNMQIVDGMKNISWAANISKTAQRRYGGVWGSSGYILQGQVGGWATATRSRPDMAVSFGYTDLTKSFESAVCHPVPLF